MISCSLLVQLQALGRRALVRACLRKWDPIACRSLSSLREFFFFSTLWFIFYLDLRAFSFSRLWCDAFRCPPSTLPLSLRKNHEILFAESEDLLKALVLDSISSLSSVQSCHISPISGPYSSFSALDSPLPDFDLRTDLRPSRRSPGGQRRDTAPASGARPCI